MIRHLEYFTYGSLTAMVLLLLIFPRQTKVVMLTIAQVPFALVGIICTAISEGCWWVYKKLAFFKFAVQMGAF